MRKPLTGEIPLMSRDAEMDWILAKLKRPEPAAFVLAGAPGVGKTRLASEAAGLGFTTAQAVASRAAAAIPRAAQMSSRYSGARRGQTRAPRRGPRTVRAGALPHVRARPRG